MPESCGAETEANALYVALLGNEDVIIPAVDFAGPEFLVPSKVGNPLYADIQQLTNDDLTTREVDGSGIFDALMASVKAHLKEEFNSNRISGAEYTKAYIALVSQAMSTGAQFLLGKEQARWNAINAQMQARLGETQLVNGNVEIEISKAKAVEIRFNALTSKANFTLSKAKLSTEGVSYCLAKYQLSTVLPAQVALTNAQTTQANKQGEMIDKQKLLTDEQIDLIKEQTEVQRAQTVDTRRDGAPVMGSVGKQKELHAQQVISYQRDADVKIAKVFTDAWITMKSVDEGLLPPTNFTNLEIDEILTKLRLNNSMN